MSKFKDFVGGVLGMIALIIAPVVIVILFLLAYGALSWLIGTRPVENTCGYYSETYREDCR